ncbi:hypothetical protein BGW36DRAFT_383520 [Talaromyces proteolyticus]|uniref:Uncharacterized protein n=1 Tax=Talaromyces proteolyticus TaxID=1131652 RepID=A0AAD4PXT5_9EURO|nr:uncharacterized protein BGW36DRAFT_383520 [Talaromyces proteolyticus]KAH8693684.1 hypothetical protein BGW36DRAFT_383520 [Talaromyces proteolyticus]
MAWKFEMEEDKESDASKTDSLRSKISKTPTIFSLCATFLLASTLSLATANYYSLFTHSFLAVSSPQFPSTDKFPEPQYSNCGDSPSEARKRNCSFDLLSFSWQTQECFDSEVINSFLAHPSRPWVYYTSPSANETVAPEVVAQGETVAYVTWEYHVVHCTYMWMQMHRAYAERGFIDSHVDSWAHTRHCQVVSLEKSFTPETVNVEGKLRYPECRRVNVGKPKDWPSDHETAFATMPPHVSR